MKDKLRKINKYFAKLYIGHSRLTSLVIFLVVALFYTHNISGLCWQRTDLGDFGPLHLKLMFYRPKKSAVTKINNNPKAARSGEYSR